MYSCITMDEPMQQIHEKNLVDGMLFERFRKEAKIISRNMVRS